MDPCKCDKCLEILKGPETWLKEDLEAGRIVHIGYKSNGQAIYRQL